MILLQLLLFLGIPHLIALLSAAPQAPTFSDNCADLQFKEIVCSVTRVDCNADSDFIAKANSSKLLPGEAHDLRIESFAKARTSSEHNLNVGISWQTPPNNSTRFLKGFLLEIDGESGQKHECFLFNIIGSNWTSEVIAHSPRLHFTSDSLFKFSQNYVVSVYSLPETSTKSSSVQQNFVAPHNPNGNGVGGTSNGGNLSEFVSVNCTKFSHPYASKWTAGFRHIFIHSVARKMQVEFVGAPPQYCFEAYEVRLLDETANELLHSGIVNVEEMHRDGNSIYGVYNFTDLEYDHVYIPSVLPVERAADGRCLCPVYGNDPYEKVVCSCIAADWKPVRINRLDIVKSIEDNSTFVPPFADRNKLQPERESFIWNPYFLLNFIVLMLICAFLLFHLGYCNRMLNPQYKRRFRLIPPPQSANINGDLEMANGEAGNSLLPTGVPVSAPLLLNPHLNLLIVYNHDSQVHEEAVMALAEYLRDVYNLQISLDCWDMGRIEKNLVDYIAASVLDADKVIFVNSLGARERYIAKAKHKEFNIEREQAGILDKIFLQQIDMVLQHPVIISTRFNYTKGHEILPQFADGLNYIIPNNMTSFMSALFGRNMKEDSRITGYSPQLTKLEMKVKEGWDYASKVPNWFVETHYKRLHKDVKANSALTASTTMSTIVEVEPNTEELGTGTLIPTTTTNEEATAANSSVDIAVKCPPQETVVVIIEQEESNKAIDDREIKHEEGDKSEIPQTVHQPIEVLVELSDAGPSATEEAANNTTSNDSGVEVSMPSPTTSSLEGTETEAVVNSDTTPAESQQNDEEETSAGETPYEAHCNIPESVLTNGIIHNQSYNNQYHNSNRSEESSDHQQHQPPPDSGVFEVSSPNSTVNGTIDEGESLLWHQDNNKLNGYHHNHHGMNGFLPGHHPAQHADSPMITEKLVPKMGSVAAGNGKRNNGNNNNSNKDRRKRNHQQNGNRNRNGSATIAKN